MVPSKRVVLLFLSVVMVCAALFMAPQSVKAQAFYSPIQFYSQLDSRWANNQLGFSAERIKDYGCLLTCCAMVDHACGAPCDPGSLNTWLKQSGGITADLIVWSHAGTFAGRAYAGYVGTGNLGSPAMLRSIYQNRGLVIAGSNRYQRQGLPHYVVIAGFYNYGLNWNDWAYFDPSDAQPVYRRIGDGWVNPGAGLHIFQH